MDGADFGPCPVAGFGISSVKHMGSAMRTLVLFKLVIAKPQVKI